MPKAESPAERAPLSEFSIVVVVPAYNEQARIEQTLRAIPTWVRHILVVDDASSDDTVEIVRAWAVVDERIELICHEANQGVGGAMVTGYRRAVELQADVVVKMDGDGQMDARFLPDLVWPLLAGEADYAKGNRFRDFAALAKMPPIRRAGNMALSFLTKASVGYWDCFDPCNGYSAIRGDLLAALPLARVQRSFFFETSMLAELYLMDAVVRDVPMPARYDGETSHLSIGQVLSEFPRKLVGCFLRRVLLKHFLNDFSIQAVYLLSGLPMLLAGILYGGANWIAYAWQGQPAPTGTVVIPAMLVILGFQLLLSCLTEDLRRTPRRPLSASLLGRSGRDSTRPGRGLPNFVSRAGDDPAVAPVASVAGEEAIRA